MADNRDPVTGRFVSTRNTPESGEGTFETYTEMPVGIQGADPADLVYDVLRHAPDGDDLGVGGSPLRPRTARLIDSRSADVTQMRVVPRRETLHADGMREAAGPHAGDLDPTHYLVGNITGIEE